MTLIAKIVHFSLLVRMVPLSTSFVVTTTTTATNKNALCSFGRLTISKRQRRQEQQNGRRPLTEHKYTRDQLDLMPLHPLDEVEGHLEEKIEEDEEEQDEMDWFRFSSIDELYSAQENDHPVNDVLATLSTSKVAVVGLGSVGSWAAEALGRSGIGNLVLVDLEDVCISQTTSGLNSLATNVGQFKTHVMKDRLQQIHPTIQVDVVDDFIMHENIQEIVSTHLHDVDVVIDCIHDMTQKIAFWKACRQRGIDCISTTSPGGKLDPTQIVYQSLKEWKQEQPPYGFDKDDRSMLMEALSCTSNEADQSLLESVQCIYSKEQPIKGAYGQPASGTVCFVSGSMGFLAASQALSIVLKRAGKESANQSLQ